MEIILLEKVVNVGEIGDIANVKNGYARNYLIPQKKALFVTEYAIAKVAERRQQLADEEGKRLDGAKARADFALKDITLTRLCGEEGRLYGSVSTLDIAEALTAAGTRIDKSEINQPDGAIKMIGQSDVEIVLHPEVRFTVQITVMGERPDGAVIESESVVPESDSSTGSDDVVDDDIAKNQEDNSGDS